MALMERRTDPTPRELRWFGVMMWPLFVVIAALLYYRSRATTAATIVFTVSTLATLLYYALPPLRKPAFVSWMTLVYPLGWVISHVLLLAVYFGVLTPIGLLLRAFGRDSLQQKLDPGADSYWTVRPGPNEPSRYFRQF